MIRAALLFELFLLFVAVPLGYRYLPVHVPVLPLLWAATLYAWWKLRQDPEFDAIVLWNRAPFAAQLSSILSTFAVSAFLLWLAVHHLTHHLEWTFVRQHSALWAAIMLLYPLISVYPQGLLYRAFFFERYDPLFPGKWAMIFASATAFALMHVIFGNWIPVVLSFAGGILFAFRYDQTGSLATSSFEHALYGCWIFTIGLGPYFYHGTIGSVGGLMQR